MIFDILVDVPIGSEDVLVSHIEQVGGDVIRDPKDPDELFYTEPDEENDFDLGGWAVVRVRNVDPEAYSRELERRVFGLRVVGSYERKVMSDAHTA